jgi:hypothetical protein
MNATPPLRREERGAVGRREGSQDVGVVDDLDDADERQHGEPDQHHRPEQVADEPCRTLDREQHAEHRDGDRQDQRAEARHRDLQPATAESTEIAGVIAPSP